MRTHREKVLSAALEVLAERGAMSSTELQRELAKRGVVATPQLIGRLLSASGRAKRSGRRWHA